MNGVHDVGGMQDFGPVIGEKDEPVFHADWEKRAFALLIATFAPGCYNIDEFRHAIERMDPVRYLSSSYYEHWLAAYERLLIEKGYITREELDKRMAKIAKGKS